MDSILLNNQQYMPFVGLTLTPLQADENTDYGLPMALQEGFRLIDISDQRLDFKGIGEVIQQCVDGDIVQREDLYIVISFHNHAYRDHPIDSRIKAMLQDLQLDYVDLCLVDKPLSWVRAIKDKHLMIRSSKNHPRDPEFERIIAQLEDEKLDEKVTAIGLNEFDKQMIMQVHDHFPALKPSVLKADMSPYFQHKETRHYCAQKNIRVIGYSGDTPRIFKNTEPPLILENPTIMQIAEKWGKREMQVVFRWFIDNGIAVLSTKGPSKKMRLIQKVREFRLDNHDLCAICDLDHQQYTHSFMVSERVNNSILQIPTVALNNGTFIPMLGISFWHKLIYMDRNWTQAEDFIASDSYKELNGVENALEAGIRHFDLAQVFKHHAGIGRIFKRYWDSGRIKRHEMFISSKIWNTFHSRQKCIDSVDQTLRDLQTSRIDLMLIHYPHGTPENGDFLQKGDSKIDYLETWKALEECVKQGKIVSIGLCNFNLDQVNRVLENAEIMPVLVQAELSIVYKKHVPLMEACLDKGIAFEATWPFGQESHVACTTINVDQSIPVANMANHLGMTARQLALLWLLHKGAIVLPRAYSFEEITSYLETLDHRLTPEQIADIDKNIPNSFPSWNDGIVDFHHRLWPWK